MDFKNRMIAINVDRQKGTEHMVNDNLQPMSIEPFVDKKSLIMPDMSITFDFNTNTIEINEPVDVPPGAILVVESYKPISEYGQPGLCDRYQEFLKAIDYYGKSSLFVQEFVEKIIAGSISESSQPE